MRWLMLTLYSPLAAFGEARAGRARQSWTRPGRSAVLGMVAAALGVDWDDLATHAAISSGLGYAVRTDATGHSLMDWHTVRIGDGAPAKRARTRGEELGSRSHAADDPARVSHGRAAHGRPVGA